MLHDIFSDDLPFLFILILFPKDIIVNKYDYFVPQSETYIGENKKLDWNANNQTAFVL